MHHCIAIKKASDKEAVNALYAVCFLVLFYWEGCVTDTAVVCSGSILRYFQLSQILKTVVPKMVSVFSLQGQYILVKCRNLQTFFLI